MNRFLCLWILFTCVLGAAGAQAATTLEVAPSDQIKYPDPSQVLNKTQAPAKPAVAPAVARSVATPAGTVATGAPAPAAPHAEKSTAVGDHGWFVKWTLTGDETGALGWVQALGLPASLHPVADGVWEVWAGPLDPTALRAALKGQGGVATLVKR